MRMSLEPGSTLDGRFEILRLIRQGGMSQVFEARDLQTGLPVAIKVPDPRFEADPAYFTRFAQEEKIGRRLEHPSILRMLAVDGKSRPYLVMERLEGALLSERLREGEPLAPAEALSLAARIARALEYLHGQGVVHRDLKPANVMLCTDGSLRVIDLGLALDLGSGPVPGTFLSTPLGTPDYMPPEHVKGRPGDARSDIYSLGAMLYEMLTGKAPFEAPGVLALMHARVVGDPVAPSKLQPRLAGPVEEIILHAMERNPEDRYASMEELREDLESPERVVLERRADRLRPPAVWRIRWLRVRSFVWTLVALLGAMGMLVLALRGSGPRGRHP